MLCCNIGCARADFLVTHHSKSLLHTARSIYVSNWRITMYEYPTELVMPNNPLNYTITSQSLVAVPAVINQPMFFSIQPVTIRETRTKNAPYPSHVYHSISSSPVQFSNSWQMSEIAALKCTVKQVSGSRRWGWNFQLSSHNSRAQSCTKGCCSWSKLTRKGITLWWKTEAKGQRGKKKVVERWLAQGKTEWKTITSQLQRQVTQ